MSTQVKPIYEFGPYCLDAGDRVLLLDGKVVPLTPKAIETLLLLVHNAGRLVSKDELMQTVWPDTFVEESGLTRNISVLRKALGDSEEGPRFIETIPKRGYRFVAEVKEHGADIEMQHVDVAPAPQPPELTAVRSPAGVPQTPQVPQSGRARYGTFWGALAMLLAGVAVLAAVVVALLRRVLPLPVPRVLSSTQITNLGAVEGAEPFVTAGHTMYFASRHGGILYPVQVSTEGGEAVPVRTPFRSAAVLAVSPDALQLLVASFSGVEEEQPLWLLPALGGSPSRLADLTGHDAAWFPGGNQILYANGNSLFVANADGTEPRKLLTAPGTPQWTRISPDGKTLRFTVVGPREELYSLWEASADGSNLHPLLSGWKPPATFWGEGECCGTWTPDAKYYLFRSIRMSGASIWAIPEKGDWLHAATHRPVEIYVSHGGLGNPVPSADGRRLFVTNGRHSRELARYDSVNHAFAPYLSGIPARWVSFSRDGRWVAYVDSRDGTLWRMAADGTQRLRLTSPPVTAFYPRWSPDGKRLLFHLVNPGVRRKLYLVPTEGGKIEMLLPGAGEEEQADWFPDGNSILFDRHDSPTGSAPVPRDICILNLNTREISALPGSQGLKFSALCPRGGYVAAVTEDARRLMLYDFRTRRWAELTTGVGIFSATWTRDSKYVYYQDLYGGLDQPVFRVRVADHKVERVTSPKLDLPVDVVSFTLTGLTPDDSPLVSLARSNSDVYALDLDLP